MKKKTIQWWVVISSLCLCIVLGQSSAFAEKTDSFIGFQESSAPSDSDSSSISSTTTAESKRETVVKVTNQGTGSNNAGKRLPQTGSVNGLYLWAGLAVLLLSFIIFIRTRRKKA